MATPRAAIHLRAGNGLKLPKSYHKLPHSLHLTCVGSRGCASQSPCTTTEMTVKFDSLSRTYTFVETAYLTKEYSKRYSSTKGIFFIIHCGLAEGILGCTKMELQNLQYLGTRNKYSM